MHRRLLNVIVLWLLALATLPPTAWAQQPGSNGANPAEIRADAVVGGRPELPAPPGSQSLRFPAVRSIFAELTASSRTAFDLNAFAARQDLASRDGPYVGFCALGFKATDADGLNPRQTLLWCITAHGRVFMFLERTTDQHQATPSLPLECALRPSGIALEMQSSSPEPRGATATAIGSKALVKRVRSILAIAIAGSVLLSPPPPNAYATSDDLAAGAPMGRGQEILPNTPRRPADGRLGPIPGWDLAEGPASSSAVFNAETQQVLVSWPNVVGFAYTGFRICREVLSGGEWTDRTMVEVPADRFELSDQPPATGTYRYRVMAFNEAAITRWSPPSQAMAEITAIDPPPPPGPVVDPFWTVFTPSADTRIVYVSSSEGNDSNDGLSEGAPKRTINAGRALLRSGYPDWLLFKCGDTFSQSGWEVGGYGGRSATEPQVWGSYGVGPRPVFTPVPGGDDTGFRINWSPANVTFSGLHIQAVEGGGGAGVLFILSSSPVSNILFEDCYIAGFKDNINIQGNAANFLRNLAFRRCIVVDAFPNGTAHSQGAYMNCVDGLLIEECVFDNNGWRNADRGDATIFNHNLYLTGGVINAVVRRNIIARASSHGIQLRAGGVIEDNLFLLNPIAAQLGGGDPYPGTHANGVSGRVEGNVILAGVNLNASNERGMGILCYNIGVQGAVIRGNIVAHNEAIGSPNATGLYLWTDSYGNGVGNNNVAISQNVFYDFGSVLIKPTTAAPAYPSAFTALSGVVFEHNDVQLPGAAVSTAQTVQVGFASQPAQVTFRNNSYWANLPDSQQLRYNNTAMNLSQWNAATGDTDSEILQVSYVDAARTIQSYSQFVGGSGTAEDFLSHARNQRRTNWNDLYSTAAVVTYIRGGYTSLP